eukprot:COSAG01_NODE_8866_length_2631_cov_129.957741_1_plen_174_part_10
MGYPPDQRKQTKLHGSAEYAALQAEVNTLVVRAIAWPPPPPPPPRRSSAVHPAHPYACVEPLRDRAVVAPTQGKINGRFGTVDAQPIFYINKFVSLVELTALYLIADVSAPFRSPVWRLLTEIPLCHGCSCQEIFRVETARQVAFITSIREGNNIIHQELLCAKSVLFEPEEEL